MILTWIEDERVFKNIFKASCYFFPGFLLIFFYDRNLFMQLDWLKLVTLSLIYTIMLSLPSIIFSWASMNLPIFNDIRILKKYSNRNKIVNKKNEALKKRLKSLKEEINSLSVSDTIKSQLIYKVNSHETDLIYISDTAMANEKKLTSITKNAESALRSMHSIISSYDSSVYMVAVMASVYTALDYFLIGINFTMRYVTLRLASIFWVLLPMLYIAATTYTLYKFSNSRKAKICYGTITFIVLTLSVVIYIGVNAKINL